jgi:AMP-polyphosphate phosphotransferase
MFETAELGRTLDETTYDAEKRELRTALLKAQTALSRSDFPVIVLLHGVDVIGAGESFNVIHEWLDARYLVTHAWEPSSEEERERPEY